ncbi:MAG: glucose-6-phosphate isomerase, partial [Armatimonadota bacterium]
MSFRYEKLPVVLDTTYLKPNVTDEMVSLRKPQVDLAYNMLTNRTCPGADFTGWIKPHKIVSDEEMKQIHETAKKLREETDVLLVIGIGGSYLGARAVIEALSEDSDRVIYAGQNISAHYKQTLMNKLKGKKVAINVVSKSGTTTEPAVAFRVLRDLVAHRG